MQSGMWRDHVISSRLLTMISFLLHLSTRLVAETLTVLLLDARGMATPALKAVEVKVALCIVS